METVTISKDAYISLLESALIAEQRKSALLEICAFDRGTWGSTAIGMRTIAQKATANGGVTNE